MANTIFSKNDWSNFSKYFFDQGKEFFDNCEDEDNEEECQWDYGIQVTYDSEKFVRGKVETYPKYGDIKKDKEGILWYLWYPSEECPGCEPDENGLSYADQIAGWYQIPSYDTIRRYITEEEPILLPDSSDYVYEPDHPDSWLRLLKIC